MSKMLIDKLANANAKSEFIINNENGHVEVRNAFWIWDNFRGDTDEFGNAKKYTNVVVPNKYVEQLINLGYTVKSYPVDKDKDGNVLLDDAGNPVLIYFIKININMKSQTPPNVKLMTKFKGEITTRQLDDNSIGDIHGLDIELAGIAWNRYVRKMPKSTMVGAYMDKLSVLAEEDAEFGGIFTEYVDSLSLEDIIED